MANLSLKERSLKQKEKRNVCIAEFFVKYANSIEISKDTIKMKKIIQI